MAGSLTSIAIPRNEEEFSFPEKEEIRQFTADLIDCVLTKTETRQCRIRLQ
jgi:hypothetical protein